MPLYMFYLDELILKQMFKHIKHVEHGTFITNKMSTIVRIAFYAFFFCNCKCDSSITIQLYTGVCNTILLNDTFLYNNNTYHMVQINVFRQLCRIT